MAWLRGIRGSDYARKPVDGLRRQVLKVIGQMRTAPASAPVAGWTFTGVTDQQVRRAGLVAEAVATARDLVNTAPNVLVPETFASRAVALGERAGLVTEVLDDERLRDNGYGGITGVAIHTERLRYMGLGRVIAVEFADGREALLTGNCVLNASLDEVLAVATPVAQLFGLPPPVVGPEPPKMQSHYSSG